MGGLSKSFEVEFSDEVFESFRTAELTCTDTSRKTVLLLGLYAREIRNCWGRILVCVDEFLCNIFAYVLLLSTVKEGGSPTVEFSKRSMLPYTRLESSSSLLYGLISKRKNSVNTLILGRAHRLYIVECNNRPSHATLWDIDCALGRGRKQDTPPSTRTLQHTLENSPGMKPIHPCNPYIPPHIVHTIPVPLLVNPDNPDPLPLKSSTAAPR